MRGFGATPGSTVTCQTEESAGLLEGETQSRVIIRILQILMSLPPGRNMGPHTGALTLDVSVAISKVAGRSSTSESASKTACCCGVCAMAFCLIRAGRSARFSRSKEPYLWLLLYCSYRRWPGSSKPGCLRRERLLLSTVTAHSGGTLRIAMGR